MTATENKSDGSAADQKIVMSRVFNAPGPRVWQALTNLNQMKQWYFEELSAFKPEVGFQTQFNVHWEGNDYLHIWKITEVVPEKRITYSWKYAGIPGESFVTFELAPEGNEKTRLTLTHTGLETFDPDKHPNYARKNFVGGWTHFMDSALPEFLEKKAAK
jgi:uncharacterized protein YndB with AHSA1/START domain